MCGVFFVTLWVLGEMQHFNSVFSTPMPLRCSSPVGFSTSDMSFDSFPENGSEVRFLFRETEQWRVGPAIGTLGRGGAAATWGEIRMQNIRSERPFADSVPPPHPPPLLQAAILKWASLWGDGIWQGISLFRKIITVGILLFFWNRKVKGPSYRLRQTIFWVGKEKWSN
jgi:hypothetical protein